MPGTSAKDDLVGRLWRGHDPMRTFALDDRPLDPQGWHSNHPYLSQAIVEVRPRFVAEIGVWKGASVMTMARAIQGLGLDGVVVAVDTWRGSSEHWLAGQGEWGSDIVDDLGLDRGFPRLYDKFIANIRAAELQHYVTPLPLDSVNAAHVFHHLGIAFGVIHLDGGHDYDSVAADLRLWWSLLQPGGILVCDDYHAGEGLWPDVRRAVDEFAGAQGVAPFPSEAAKALIRKPHA